MCVFAGRGAVMSLADVSSSYKGNTMFFVDSTKSEEFMRFKDKHSPAKSAGSALSSSKRRSGRSLPPMETPQTVLEIESSVLNESKHADDLDGKPEDTLLSVLRVDALTSTPFTPASNQALTAVEARTAFSIAPIIERELDSKIGYEEAAG